MGIGPNTLMAPIRDRIGFYVPDKCGSDQVKDTRTQEFWIEEIAGILSDRNGGATIIDTMFGAWRSVQADQIILKERS